MNGGEPISAGAPSSEIGPASMSREGPEPGEAARRLLVRYGVPAELVSDAAGAAWREQEEFARSVLVRAYAPVWERDDE